MGENFPTLAPLILPPEAIQAGELITAPFTLPFYLAFFMWGLPELG